MRVITSNFKDSDKNITLFKRYSPLDLQNSLWKRFQFPGRHEKAMRAILC